MNHSKYNPKYDPKHSAYQPQATAPVEQIAAVTPVANTPPVQVATSPQTETGNSNAVIAEPNRQDAPVAMQAATAITDKDMNASISDSSQPSTGQGLHVVREPSALTGGLPELPVAQIDSETGEKTPGLLSKSMS